MSSARCRVFYLVFSTALSETGFFDNNMGYTNMYMQYQVTLLALIRILRMFMITMPVIVLYWQSHGLLMKDIFILQVIYSKMTIVIE